MLDALDDKPASRPAILFGRIAHWFGRRDQADRDALERMLAAAPCPWAVWGSNGQPRLSPEALALFGAPRSGTWSDIEKSLAPGEAERVAGLVQALRGRGQAFETELRLAEGNSIELTGRRAETQRQPVDLLWFRRGSAAAPGASDAPAPAVLSALFDTLPVPLWLRGDDLEIVWCNQAFAEWMERDRATVLKEGREIGTSILDQSGRGVAQRASTRREPQTESRHIVVRGARLLIEITECPGGSGGPAFGFAIDRTKLEEVEAELERHLSAHAEVLEQLRSAIAIYGPDMRLKFYNGAMCELWGLSEQWMATQPTLTQLLELLRERRQLPEQADFRRYKQDQVAMFTSLIEPHQELMYRPDGSVLRLLVVPHPLGGLMYSYEDVTSRLALESSYNTLIAVQRETLDNLAEGIAVFGGDGRLGLWNPPFARLWSLEPDELDARPHIGDLVKRMEPFFTPGGESIRDILVGNALDRTPRLGRIQRADGVTLEYRGVPLPDGAVLNSFIDVTDSVRFEQVLRDRNDALIAADQLKLDFLANVSYQLRTPLNAMIGFSEILTNRYFGELNARQEEYIQGVLQAGRRLEALIDAILDLSSIEAGYLRLELEPIDIAAMVEEVRAITGDWAQRERIDLIAQCDPDVGSILGDGRRIKQALLNLVSNAIKFTRPGGRIELSAAVRNGGVVLTVADDGIGIPEEDRERVFAPFERARRAHPRSGAGVGLALVKRFISMHSGSVELTSDPDRGTRVDCVLPRRPTSETSDDAALPAGRAKLN